MITIVDYSLITSKEGMEIYSLVLQGGIEMFISKAMDRYYATLKKCSITSTFDEKTAKAIIGTTIPGSIQKQTCDPYTFTAKETGEMLVFTYRWVYFPEGATLEEAIWEREPEQQEERLGGKQKELFLHR